MFAAIGDDCIANPEYCGDGLSVSLFYKVELDIEPDDLETNISTTFQREYILSTGRHSDTGI